MEYIQGRRAAFEKALDVTFAAAKSGSICGSLIVGPWYHNYVKHISANLSSFHLYEMDIHDSLYQMYLQGYKPELDSVAAYTRTWKAAAEEATFPIHLHFGAPTHWDGGQSGNLNQFWSKVTQKELSHGQVILILDTCTVKTLGTLVSALHRDFPEKLQPGTVLMTNVSLSRRGEERAEACESRLLSSLTNYPCQLLQRHSYNSKRHDGYFGHRRRLSVFKVE